MNLKSLLQIAVKVHPLIVLPVAAAVSWTGVGLVAPVLASAPAQARPSPDSAMVASPLPAGVSPTPRRAPGPIVSSETTGSIPAGLPATLSAAPAAVPVAALAPAAAAPFAIGPATGGDAGMSSGGGAGSDSGGGSGGQRHRHPATSTATGAAVSASLGAIAPREQPPQHTWPAATPHPAIPRYAPAPAPPAIRTPLAATPAPGPMLPQFGQPRPEAFTPQFAQVRQPSFFGGLFGFRTGGGARGGYGGGRFVFRRR